MWQTVPYSPQVFPVLNESWHVLRNAWMLSAPDRSCVSAIGAYLPTGPASGSGLCVCCPRCQETAQRYRLGIAFSSLVSMVTAHTAPHPALHALHALQSLPIKALPNLPLISTHGFSRVEF